MFTSARAHTGVLLFLMVPAFILGLPHGAAAKEWESESHNCVLSILGPPAAWEWLPADPGWAKAGVIRGATRKLDRLRNGKPGDGHGGLLHLACRDAHKGMTLERAAADKGVRSFLLARFGGSEGDVLSERGTVVSADMKEHPAIVLRARGEANNLRGKKGKATGVMLITVAKGKLYLVRMYAFPTESDEEGLGTDLDTMEGECLELISTKEEQPPAPEPATDHGPQAGPEEGEEKVLEDRAQRWRLTKPARIKRVDLTDDDRANDMALRFGDVDRGGGYAVFFYAIPNSRVVGGQRMPAPNLGEWMSRHWWSNFTTNHPKGDVFTWTWPKKTRNGAFLTIPFLEDEKNRKDVITGDLKRPVVIGLSDAVKKMKFVEKPKKRNLGKRGKASEALRGCLEGRRPKFPGQETLCRFAWRNGEHSYRLIVTMYGKAYLKWGPSLRELLESFEFDVRFKKP